LIDGASSGCGVWFVSLLCGIVFHVLSVFGGSRLRGIVVLSSRWGWEALLCCLVGQEVDALGVFGFVVTVFARFSVNKLGNSLLLN
jgi:hypothetical protein